MLKINPYGLQGVNFTTAQKKEKTSFQGSTNPQNIDALPDIPRDYSVKKPMAYAKTGELNLPYDTKAHMYKLANGQRVVVIPKEGAKTFLETYVNTGSLNEFDNIRGISHYIEHNLFNGSDGLEAGEFFATTDKMGAETNASTSFAETNYYIGSNLLNEGDLEKKIKIHASMLESPKFAQNMLNKEKGIVNSEINMVTANPENIAVNNTLKNLFGYKTTSPDLIAGSTSNITNLTKKDVEDYFDRNYYPANMVTVICGDIKPDEVMPLMSKYFTSTKAPTQVQHNEPVKELKKTVRNDIISDKATSTSVVLGFAGPENNNSKDRILAYALGTLITNSADLNKELTSLNTSLYSGCEKMGTKPSAKQAIILNSEMSDENSEKFLKSVYKELNKRLNTPPTQDELNMVKKKMLRNFSGMFECSCAINEMTGKAILEDNLASITDFEKIVNEMTPQDLVNTARKYFNPNKAAITVMHPTSANAETISKNHSSVAFTGSLHKTAINMDEVNEYKLPNNVKLVTNNTQTRKSTYTLSFDTEKPIKITNPAAPFVLNNILNKGSLFRDDDKFRSDNNKDDIHLAFSFGDQHVCCYGDTDSSDVLKSLATAKEVLFAPRFTQETLDEVKKQIKDEILRSEKTPTEKLNAELYKGHLAGTTDKEVLENLDKVTLDDLKNLYSQVMSNAKGAFTISAPLRQNPELMNGVLGEISTLPTVKDFSPKLYEDFKPQDKSKVLTDTHNKNQADIVMAYKFKVNGNLKDSVTLELLNNILGGGPSSRLFNDLREKQKLAYAVRSGLDNSHDTKVLKLSIGTTTENKDTGEISYDNLQKSVEGFKNHVQKLKTERVTPEELQNAKLALKDSILTMNQAGAGKCDTLASSINTPYGITRANQILDIIDTITSDDIYNAANYIFSQKPVYSIVASENTLKNNADYLKTLEA